MQTTAFSPGGQEVLTGHDNTRTATLWHWESARRIHELPGHGDRVMSVAFSPDGHRALTGDQDGLVRPWNLDSGRLIGRLGTHEGWVLNVAFSPDGRRGYSTCQRYGPRV
jgi:WD40 repeat protein